jgi:hypothetical protein
LMFKVIISKPNPTSILAKPMLFLFLHLIHIDIRKYITWWCLVSYFFGNFLSKNNIILWKWNILVSTPYFLKTIFWGRLSSHLCLLVTIWRVPWNNITI